MKLYDLDQDLQFQHVLPELSLRDLASLACTCRTLHAVTAAAPDVCYRPAAQQQYPVTHPVHEADDVRDFLQQQHAWDLTLSRDPHFTQAAHATRHKGVVSPDLSCFAARAKHRPVARIVDLQTGALSLNEGIGFVPSITKDAHHYWQWDSVSQHVMMPFGAAWEEPADGTFEESPPSTPSSQQTFYSESDSSANDESYDGWVGMMLFNSLTGEDVALVRLQTQWSQLPPYIPDRLHCQRLLVVHADLAGSRTLSLVDFASGTMASMSAPEPIRTARLSPDGEYVVLDTEPPGQNTMLQIWNAQLGPIPQLGPIGFSAHELHWSPHSSAVLCESELDLAVYTLLGDVGSARHYWSIKRGSVTWGMGGVALVAYSTDDADYRLFLHQVSSSGEFERSRKFSVSEHDFVDGAIAPSPSGRHLLVPVFAHATLDLDEDCNQTRPDTLALIATRTGAVCCTVKTLFEPGKCRWASDASAILVERGADQADLGQVVLLVRFC